MRNNCIFISANKDFFEILILCLKSIIQNYPNHPLVYICYTDFSNLEKEKIKRLINNVEFINNSITDKETGPIMGHLSKLIDPKVFYARLLIWKLPLFSQYDAVLHLDADTLVLQDLSKLFQKKEFYIEKECYNWEDSLFYNKHDSELLKLIISDWLIIPKSFQPWNAWIFLVPKKYLTKRVYNELIVTLYKYKPHIKRSDQSILNLRIIKKWIIINDEHQYNVQHRLIMNQQLFEDISNYYIIHFNGVSSNIRLIFMKLFLFLYPFKGWLSLYRILYNSFSKD